MVLLRWPSNADWQFAAFCALGFAVLAIPFGLMSGSYRWAPNLFAPETLRVAAIALVLPALMEELVFRGPLVWWQEKYGDVPLRLTLATLTAFVAWHPINAMTFMPQAAETFLDWRFLLVTTLFAVSVTIMTLRTRSLWPAIVFHWLLVVAWKGLFGAPSFL